MSPLPAGRDLSRPHAEVVVAVRLRRRQRLDRFLQHELGWKSRTRVQRLIELGRVQVNSAPAKCSRRIGDGDEIRIRIRTAGDPAPPRVSLPAPFWEDAFLLAIDKPSGCLVHPVGRTLDGTVINELHRHYARVNERGLRRVVPRLCHRLDRDTTGVLLVARTQAARRALSRAFEEERVAKQYLAVVAGVPARREFEIDLPIAVLLDRERSPARRHRRSEVDPAGKPARTLVTCVAAGTGFSVLRCRPRTGRQNQIRAHLAAVGHPILGDIDYGSTPLGGDPSPPFPERPLLHSAAIDFPHPVWGTRHVLRAPPPADFRPFIASSHAPDEPPRIVSSEMEEG